MSPTEIALHPALQALCNAISACMQYVATGEKIPVQHMLHFMHSLATLHHMLGTTALQFAFSAGIASIVY